MKIVLSQPPQTSIKSPNADVLANVFAMLPGIHSLAIAMHLEIHRVYQLLNAWFKLKAHPFCALVLTRRKISTSTPGY